ncbi:MAG TPA: hypothetical protein VFI86_02490, partial [Burkholderiales bacterium]|nr:hypothetical protein [Burkholderiales bacterium]
ASDRPLEAPASPAALQVRRFTASSGAPRHLLLAELARAGEPAPAVSGAGLLRVYRAYAA